MVLDPEDSGQWLSEVEHFINHWTNETEELQHRLLNPQECMEIADNFQRDSDGLLLRRPKGILDDPLLARLEQLDQKLNSQLALVCSVQRK